MDSGTSPQIDRPRVVLLAPHTEWIYPHLVPSLRRLCDTVYAYPIGNYMASWYLLPWPSLRPRLLDRFFSDISAIHRDRPIDLVLNMQYDDTLRPRDVRRLRDLGMRVVTYHVDMFLQWYRVLRQAPWLDLLAVSHMEFLHPFIRRGVPVHFMPMAASPDRCDLTGRDVPAAGVLMLGSASPDRARVVAECRGVTDRVDVYGGGWDRIFRPDDAGPRAARRKRNRVAKAAFDIGYLAPRLRAEGIRGVRRCRTSWSDLAVHERRLVASARYHGYAEESDISAIMARADITLGVNQRIESIGARRGFADSRLRDFEATLAGAFYLVQSYVDLPAHFRPGEEVESWSSLEALREKIAWYLDRPEERRRIADAGQVRARSEHTWDARFAMLFHRLGLVGTAREDPAPLHVVANLSQHPWCSNAPGCTPDEPSAVDPAIDAEGRLRS